MSVTETAAEKLVALTRRTAMELAGLSRDPDPTLVRHIYDLHMMRGHLTRPRLPRGPRHRRDRCQEFRNQYPAYAADIAGETGKALEPCELILAPPRYDDFVFAMVYGERAEFAAAFTTVGNGEA